MRTPRKPPSPWAALPAALLTLLALSPACAERAARGSGAPGGAAPQGQVRLVGRAMLDAFDPDAIGFGWQGAGLIATVRGTRLVARLVSQDGKEIFFDLTVDGRPMPRFSVSSRTEQEVTLADGLRDGPHVVELVRDTESHQGLARFQGFAAGVVEEAPPSSGRLLEIVGDSVSTGYGNLGRETHSPQGDEGECTWAASSSSWARSYGALAGRALGAEVSTIAMSGWGMYEGGDDDREHAMGKVYARTYGAYVPGLWMFPRTPQAAVVYLGANDVGPREKPTFDRRLYVEAGLDLVAQIRAHAPDAWIFLALGLVMEEPVPSMLRDAQQAIVDQRRSNGDQRIERLEFPAPPPAPGDVIVTGCQWHPSLADHQRMAEVLRQRLHERLGW